MAKKRRGAARVVTVGAPEWMATYSDMMSLLLCFFILLFSAAEEKREKVFELIMGFQRYFKNNSRQLGYYPKRLSMREISGFIENSVRPPSKKGSRGKSETTREEIEKIDQYAAIYKEDNHEVVVVPGLVLFERGKAELRPESHATLARVARTLKRRGKADFKIVGHTSSWPLDADADASDHLQLGFKRALAIAKHLSEHEQVSMSRMTLATHGSQVPSPSRKNLWEDPEKDDRVEIMFLPAHDLE